VKLNADPRLPVPEWTLDYLRRLNARWYEVWRSLVTAVNERLTVQHNGARVGAQPVLNLIDGTGASLTVTEDLAEGRIDVEIAASGGSGGGSCCEVRYVEDSAGALLDNSSSQSDLGFNGVGLPAQAPNTCSVVVMATVTAEMPASTATETSSATFWLMATIGGQPSAAFAVFATTTLTAPIYDDSGPLLTLSATLHGIVTLPDAGSQQYSIILWGGPTNENLAQVLVRSSISAFVLPCVYQIPT
jgi:hypothetical protein